MSDAVRLLELDRPFTLHRGGVLHGAQIAYETWGTLNAARDNAVLLFTGLSPSAHAASSPQDPSAGWWEEMLGCGRPIDTERFFVVCINSLGSCFGSTGPASLDPATGAPYRLDFPVLTIEDIAQGGAEVVNALDIAGLRAVVGPSMGGMTALAYCLQSPTPPVEALVSVSSAPRALPFAIALRSLQREIIRSDPKWNAGAYAADDGPLQGMRLARKLGMITYRSAKEWKQRFGRERAPAMAHDPFGVEFEVESYLAATANKFTGGFDANCYLYLSRAMDLFDSAEHGSGSLPTAIGELTVEKALVVGAETDFLFPPEQQEELATLLGDAGKDVTYRPLVSLQGHDSFLVDMDRFRPAISDFFRRL